MTRTAGTDVVKANDPTADLDIHESARTPAASRRFRIIAELGEGGMARVHLAVARSASGVTKLVVLKTLRSHLASDQACLEMFLHEARLAARLNHPNVIQTYEVTEDAGRQVMVMEYLEGQPLSHVFARARKGEQIPLEMYVHILCDTLAGLHYAQELRDFDGTKMDLVHRDVSPQNIFVTFEGQVKILDFGIAKAAVNAPNETETGVLKGKVRYMAPEQIVGDPVDRRADIFAVGAVLWEILAQEKIWSGVPDMVVMQRVTTGDIPSPRTVNPNVPESLERICLKAMSLEPLSRYATSQEFQIALEGALNELGGSFRQRDLGNRVAELFADIRAEIRATIEAQMRLVEGLSSTQLETLEPVPLYGLGLTPTPFRTGTERSEVAKPDPSRGRRLALVVGGVGIAVAVLAWVGARRAATSAPPSIPSAAAAPIATATTAPASAPRLQLGVYVTPAQGRIFFDGTELPSNPYMGSYVQDGSKHQLRGEAAGYVPQSVEVTLDRDMSVALTLEREKPAPKGARADRSGAPARAASSAAPEPSATAAAAKPNCAQPYYFDSQGIKKIRAECL